MKKIDAGEFIEFREWVIYIRDCKGASIQLTTVSDTKNSEF